jgi:hypothetical protein
MAHERISNHFPDACAGNRFDVTPASIAELSCRVLFYRMLNPLAKSPLGTPMELFQRMVPKISGGSARSCSIDSEFGIYVSSIPFLCPFISFLSSPRGEQKRQNPAAREISENHRRQSQQSRLEWG